MAEFGDGNSDGDGAAAVGDFAGVGGTGVVNGPLAIFSSCTWVFDTAAIKMSDVNLSFDLVMETFTMALLYTQA